MGNRQIQLKSTQLSENTQKVYHSTFAHLENYLKTEVRRSDILLPGVKYSFIENFRDHLLGTCNANSANKYLKTLRAVLNQAIKEEIITRNPFDHVRLKPSKYDRTYLTENDLTIIMQADLEDPKLDIARDFMVVSSFYRHALRGYCRFAGERHY